MAIKEFIQKKFDQRYEKLTTDKSRVQALIIWYMFLTGLTITILILVPDVALNIISRLFGI